MAWDTLSQRTDDTQQQTTGQGTQATTGNVATQNQFGAGQQQLQNQVPNLYSQLLGGNIPQQFTAPQSVIDNYKQQFDTWTAPQLALRGGSGGPMIEANRALGLSDLLSRLYQQGVGNYGQALGAAGNFSLNPIGTSGSSGSNVLRNDFENKDLQSETNYNSQYQALDRILSMLRGLGQSGGVGQP